jgi:lipopolysaccharide/colanic/teichoic acid biosynthesis glycosyltransferase
MKRLFDIVVSMISIVLLIPLFGILYIFIWINLGTPVSFSQSRPGLYGKPFVMYKFRTMRDAVDENGLSLPDEVRLTNFGKFLRSTSLDELPELWNVLKGEMSLVGPRPLLMEYLPLYSAEQARRHNVLPGITGWAQVNGRNSLSWEEKFKLDVWYVENHSFFLDLKILFLTLKKIFIREGISAEGVATMNKFTGNL